MGLFDFLKKKTKSENETVERSMPTTLEGFDPSTVVPPDTRFTQEYQDFLAAQEAAGQNRELSETADAAAEGMPEGDSGEGEPCGECVKDAVPDEVREYCDAAEETAEEAAHEEESPAEVIAPETDDILSDE